VDDVILSYGIPDCADITLCTGITCITQGTLEASDKIKLEQVEVFK